MSLMPRALVGRVLFPLHERLKGKPTYAYLRDLERTQWLSPGALRELQFRRLKEHLDFAYREVPYYQRVFAEHDLHPSRIASFEDFSRVPCLTREEIRRLRHELQPRRPVRGARAISTGGSTGAPVTVMTDPRKSSAGDAARLRAHRWFGVDVGVPEVVLWGSPIEGGRQDTVRNLRDRFINSTFLSAFDMGEAALARYVTALVRKKPAKIFGYASAVFLLARYLRRIGWTTPGSWPLAIFVTAEPLFPFQRALIESVFGAPVAVEYGARDAGLIANQCPAGGLHVNAEGILVELATADSGVPASSGEVIVTNLDSWAMPIIRYRTGDIAEAGGEACACGRGLPLLGQVQGRATDFLVTPDGRVMHALAAIYVMREIASVEEFQIVQEDTDRLRVLVVAERGDPRGTSAAIVGGFRGLFGPDVAISVDVVEAIPRAPSGKFRHVISRVAEEHLAATLGGAR